MLDIMFKIMDKTIELSICVHKTLLSVYMLPHKTDMQAIDNNQDYIIYRKTQFLMYVQ